MEVFSFHNPTRILFGEGQIHELGHDMKLDGISKCLLIAGGGSLKENGAYGQITQSLNNAGITLYESWGVQANPRIKCGKLSLWQNPLPWTRFWRRGEDL